MSFLPGHPFEHPENCINVYINFLQNWKFQSVEVRTIGTIGIQVFGNSDRDCCSDLIRWKKTKLRQ